MSRPEDPEQPTERLVPHEHVVREREVAHGVAVETAWIEHLADAVRTLRVVTALALVLALAAAGLSVWALMRADEADDTGASAGRVSQLADRVNQLESRTGDSASLESRLEDRATKGELDRLRSQISDLRRAIDDSSSSNDSQQAIDQLGDRVDELAADVDQLRSEASATP